MAWIQIANLKGPRGYQGLPGSRGIPGLPGAASLPADDAVAAYVDTAGTSATKTALQKSFTHKPDLISNLVAPTFVAHRGGLNLYPEEGMEGARRALQSQFLPECDVTALADGTMVMLHDDTVDRTMTGQTGSPSTMTRDQWLSMKINPAVKGGKTGQTFLFEDWLDELGGKTVLVPEIKQFTASLTNAVIAAIKDRGLDKSVIVQCFDFETCRTVAAAGLEPLFLFGSSTSYSAADIKAAGINFVGPSNGASDATIASLKAAGLTVWLYTINTPSSWQAARDRGADGAFSNDPWYISGRYARRSSDPFGEGYGWPGIRAHYEVANKIYTATPTVSGNALQFAPVDSSSNDVQVVYQDWAGLLNVPVEIGMRIEFGTDTDNSAHGFGFVLYSNLATADADFLDSALPGQNGYTAMIRRSGKADAWTYTDGGAAVSFLSQYLDPQFATVDFAPDFKPATLDVTFRLTGTDLTIEAPAFKFSTTATHGLTVTTPLRFALRGPNSSSARISNVRVRQL